MKFTGERVIPGEGDEDLLNEHRARYLFAERFSAGQAVLDVACGSGYGAALLGEKAAAVFGVDRSAEAVHHARRHYESPKVHFAQSDCLTLPFPSGKFHLVVAFEIIEHLEDPEAFLSELHRVLHPAGLLVLSTPNRLYYTEERDEVNPFHVREFSFAELKEILKPLFPHRAILFENHVAGLLVSGPDEETNLQKLSGDSILQEENDSAAGSEERAEEREKTAHYLVALCSSRPLDPARPLLYLPSTGNVLRERELHIRSLTDHLTQARAAAEQAREHVEQVTAQRVHFQQQEKKLEQLLEERTQWARELDRQVEERTQWALNLQQELDRTGNALQKLQEEFEERTNWALRLDAELKERLEDLRRMREDLSCLYGSRWYRIGKNLRLSPIPASDQKPPQAVKPKAQ